MSPEGGADSSGEHLPRKTPIAHFPQNALPFAKRERLCCPVITAASVGVTPRGDGNVGKLG
jgi:hypothetical protein